MQNVTFIVQGGIYEEDVQEVVARSRIQEFFPESKIVVSHWGGEPGTVTTYDSITQVSNGTPRRYDVKGERWAANFENQCISTVGGLNLCNTEYAVKIRSDCFFVGDNLRRIFENFVLSTRVLLVSTKSISYPYPFYASDYFQLGYTHQLKRIWETSLEIGIDLERYTGFGGHLYDRRTDFFASLHPEQVLYFSQFGGEIKYRDYKPSVSEFVAARVAIDQTNFCVGRVNLQIEGVKYSNSILHFCPFFFSSRPLSIIRSLLSLAVGALVR